MLEWSNEKMSEWIFARTMYKVEGRCPERRSHLALEHYRTVRNADRFDSGGLLPTNGPAWEKMRKQFQVRLLPNLVCIYFPSCHCYIGIYRTCA